jgi:hypothetical protein
VLSQPDPTPSPAPTPVSVEAITSHFQPSWPAPSTIVHEFAESTIVLRCWIWAPPDRRWFIKDDAVHRHRLPQRVLHGA